MVPNRDVYGELHFKPEADGEDVPDSVQVVLRKQGRKSFRGTTMVLSHRGLAAAINGLSGSARLLLLSVLSWVGWDNRIEGSRNAMADATGMSLPTVYRALKELKEARVFVDHPVGNGGSGLYLNANIAWFGQSRQCRFRQRADGPVEPSKNRAKSPKPKDVKA